MEFIETTLAPEPLGHYAQGVKAGNMVYTAMQLPINPDKPEEKTDDVETMANQLISNVVGVIKVGGGDIGNIVKVTVYFSDLSMAERFNQVYENAMGHHKPARSVVPIAASIKGWPMAMEAVAVIEE